MVKIGMLMSMFAPERPSQCRTLASFRSEAVTIAHAAAAPVTPCIQDYISSVRNHQRRGGTAGRGKASRLSINQMQLLAVFTLENKNTTFEVATCLIICNRSLQRPGLAMPALLHPSLINMLQGRQASDQQACRRQRHPSRNPWRGSLQDAQAHPRPQPGPSSSLPSHRSSPGKPGGSAGAGDAPPATSTPFTPAVQGLVGLSPTSGTALAQALHSRAAMLTGTGRRQSRQDCACTHFPAAIDVLLAGLSCCTMKIEESLIPLVNCLPTRQ